MMAPTVSHTAEDKLSAGAENEKVPHTCCAAGGIRHSSGDGGSGILAARRGIARDGSGSGGPLLLRVADLLQERTRIRRASIVLRILHMETSIHKICMYKAHASMIRHAQSERQTKRVLTFV